MWNEKNTCLCDASDKIEATFIALLALGVVVLDEVLEQIHTFLALNFIHFNEVLCKRTGGGNTASCVY